MDKIFWLIFAHFTGDVALQAPFLIEAKRKSWFFLIAHSIVYAGCVGVALVYIDKYSIWKILFLILGHSVIDVFKMRQRIDLTDDQTLHLIQLLICLI